VCVCVGEGERLLGICEFEVPKPGSTFGSGKRAFSKCTNRWIRADPAGYRRRGRLWTGHFQDELSSTCRCCCSEKREKRPRWMDGWLCTGAALGPTVEGRALGLKKQSGQAPDWRRNKQPAESGQEAAGGSCLAGGRDFPRSWPASVPGRWKAPLPTPGHRARASPFHCPSSPPSYCSAPYRTAPHCILVRACLWLVLCAKPCPWQARRLAALSLSISISLSLSVPPSLLYWLE